MLNPCLRFSCKWYDSGFQLLECCGGSKDELHLINVLLLRFKVGYSFYLLCRDKGVLLRITTWWLGHVYSCEKQTPEAAEPDTAIRNVIRRYQPHTNFFSSRHVTSRS
jgi:hypothetical protein